MPSAQPITDHDQIRQWAEERGARPACVKGTGGKNDPGMIRLDFPGYGGAESLQPISWPEWFRQFDENNLALLVQGTTSRGQKSNFNKLVSRRGAAARGRSRTRSTAGQSRSKQAGAGRSRAKQAGTARARKQTGARSASRKTAGSRGQTRTTRTGAKRSSRSGTTTAKKTARRRAR